MEDGISGLMFFAFSLYHNCPGCLWYNLLINSVLQGLEDIYLEHGSSGSVSDVTADIAVFFDPNMRFLVSIFSSVFHLLSYVRLTSEHESFNEAYSKLRYS